MVCKGAEQNCVALIAGPRFVTDVGGVAGVLVACNICFGEGLAARCSEYIGNQQFLLAFIRS